MTRLAEARIWPLLAFALLVGLQAALLMAALGGMAESPQWEAVVPMLAFGALAFTVLLAVGVMGSLSRAQTRPAGRS